MQSEPDSRKAFTLIELLVVISIISLLSSVVLASLNSAREKARLAAGKQFAANVYHAAADSAVGIWNFDECGGTTVADLSGTGNNGSFVGSPVWSTNTPSGNGCSLDFANAANYVLVPDSPSLDLANDFTVSLWLYFKVQTPSVFLVKGDSINHGASPSYGFDGNGYMYIAYNSSNSPYDIRRSSDINEWHQFTGVISGGVRSMYIDGKLVSTSSGGVYGWNNTNDLTIGKGTTYSSNATIDEVRVYAKTLTAREVGELYAEESAAHELAKAKSRTAFAIRDLAH